MVRDDTRELLLEHGTRLILEAGYERTGIQAILAAAGVPKGSFYHYFTNKEAFGLAVLDRYFAALMADVTRLLADAGSTPLGRLRGCFEFYRDYFVRLDCCAGCLLGNLSQELADRSPAFRARLQEHIAEWAGRIEVVLAEAREAEEIAPTVEVAEAARFCLQAWEGSLLMMKVTKSIAPVERFLAFFFGNVLGA